MRNVESYIHFILNDDYYTWTRMQEVIPLKFSKRVQTLIYVKGDLELNVTKKDNRIVYKTITHDNLGYTCFFKDNNLNGTIVKKQSIEYDQFPITYNYDLEFVRTSFYYEFCDLSSCNDNILFEFIHDFNKKTTYSFKVINNTRNDNIVLNIRNIFSKDAFS